MEAPRWILAHGNRHLVRGTVPLGPIIVPDPRGRGFIVLGTTGAVPFHATCLRDAKAIGEGRA